MEETVKEDSVLVKAPVVASRRIDDETIVLKAEKFPEAEQDNRIVRYFNKTGTLIWEMIDGDNDASKIGDNLIRCFDVPQEQALKEVIVFLNLLYKEGLVILK